MEREIFKRVEEWINSLEKPYCMGTKAKEFEQKFRIEVGWHRGFFGIPWDCENRFSGLILHSLKDYRHPLHSSLIGAYEYQPYIIRGYPCSNKITKKPSLNSKTVIQESYDGIPITFYRLPHGEVVAKTKQLEYIERYSIVSRDYKSLIEKSGAMENIKKLLNDNPDYVIFGELYGNHESLRGYVDYDVEAHYIAFDILHRPSYKFLDCTESDTLFSEYEIDSAPFIWSTYEIDDVLNERVEGLVYKEYKDGEINVRKQYSKYMLGQLSKDDRKINYALRKTLDNN
jgi:hypothetical protein